MKLTTTAKLRERVLNGLGADENGYVPVLLQVENTGKGVLVKFITDDAQRTTMFTIGPDALPPYTTLTIENAKLKVKLQFEDC